ncbi:MAG: hypothetical protein ACOX66_07470 [Oscillospiraceae bacterium]|jgi:hypothetical protein
MPLQTIRKWFAAASVICILHLTMEIRLHTFGIDLPFNDGFYLERRAEFQLVPM